MRLTALSFPSFLCVFLVFAAVVYTLSCGSLAFKLPLVEMPTVQADETRQQHNTLTVDEPFNEGMSKKSE